MSNIENWSTTAGSNTFAPPDGFPEGMQQRDFNDGTRELMAAVRRWFDDPEWQNFNGAHAVTRTGVAGVRIAGVDLTAYYTALRRVRLLGGGDVQGTITASVFSAGNTDVTITVDNAGTVPVGTNAIYVNMVRSLRSGGTTPVGTVPGSIPLNTGSGALGTAAYKDFGAVIGNLVQHIQNNPIGSAAYLNGGARTYTESKGGNQTGIADSTDTLITGLNNITVPGTPDGVKKYRITGLVQVKFNGSGDQAALVRVRIGTNGNITDAVALEVPITFGPATTGQVGAIPIPPFDFAVPAVGKLSLSFMNVDTPGGASVDILLGTTTGRFCYVTVEEVLR